MAAQDVLTRFTQWQGREPESVAADTTYGEFLQWLADRSITPYMRSRDSIHRKNSPFPDTSVCSCSGSSVGFCCTNSTR